MRLLLFYGISTVFILSLVLWDTLNHATSGMPTGFISVIRASVPLSSTRSLTTVAARREALHTKAAPTHTVVEPVVVHDEVHEALSTPTASPHVHVLRSPPPRGPASMLTILNQTSSPAAGLGMFLLPYYTIRYSCVTLWVLLNIRYDITIASMVGHVL